MALLGPAKPFDAITKSEETMIKSDKGTSKKALQRQRRAARKAAQASPTVKPEDTQDTKGFVVKSPSRAFSSKADDSSESVENIALTKPTVNVVRLIGTDIAKPNSAHEQKSLPVSKSTAPPGFAVKEVQSVLSPTTVVATDALYSAVASKPPSPTVPKYAQDEKTLDITEANAYTRHSTPGSSSFHSTFPISPTTSPDNTKDKVKVRKLKSKPMMDADGWTIIPVPERDEPDPEKSSLSDSTSMSSPNRFDALRDSGRINVEEIDGPVKVGCNNKKTTPGKKNEGSNSIANIPTSAATSTSPAHAKVSYVSPKPVGASILQVDEGLSGPATTSTDISPDSMSIFKSKQKAMMTKDELESVYGVPASPSQLEPPATTTQPWAQHVPISEHSLTSVSLETEASIISKTEHLLDTPIKNDFSAMLPATSSRRNMSPARPFASVAKTTSLAPPSSIEFPISSLSTLSKTVKDSSSSSLDPIVEQKLDDLLNMIRHERRSLLKGPRITIYIGDKQVPHIAKRAAMATSSVLNEHFTKNPKSLEYRFPDGSLNPAAVRVLLISWMQHTCQLFEAEPVHFCNSFKENIALLRAARFLGMERYTKHILRFYVEYLKTELPQYSEIVTIENMMTSDKDPLWTGMVNHLTHLHFKGLIPDPDNFSSFLGRHAKLKNAMESANGFFRDMARQRYEAMDAARRAKFKAEEEARYKRWLADQKKDSDRIKREKQLSEALRYKFNDHRNTNMGVQMITQEEADYLRGWSTT